MSAARAPLLATLKWCPRWPFWLLCSLVLPSELSFMIGGLRLHPTRVILILAFLPALFRVLGGRAGAVRAMDALMALTIVWAIIVLGYHHGLSVALQTGGMNMLELGGSYLIARAWIRDEREYRGAMALIVVLICVLAPFVLFETITGSHLIKTLASGHKFYSEIETRMGLTRAYGPFDHPIHLGIFAASVLAIAWMPALPQLGSPRPRRLPLVGLLTSTASSMSSGGIFTLGVQGILLFWEKLTRRRTARWKKFVVLLATMYAVIGVFSNRSPTIVVLSYLTFSPETAYNRAMIFDWGLDNIKLSPMMGIGLNDWIRPEWVFSNSMDNFWLVQAVTYGIPGFLFLGSATLWMLAANWETLTARLRRLRMAWTISMLALIFAATTVHLWNSLYVYFAFMLGTGAWFHDIRRTCVPDERHDFY